jgi:hypothetical protein
MSQITALALAFVMAAPSPDPSPSPSAAPTADTLVDRAVAARGGKAALEGATVFEWRGRATVYRDQDQKVVLDGRWIVEPPDRAVVVTTEVGKGRESTRRTALLGTEGWTEVGGERRPIPPEVAAAARELSYFASLARALPLRDAGLQVTMTGPRTLRVEAEGRPAVELVYDGTGWLDTLRAGVLEITFAGEVFSKGVRWPRRINVTRDGAPVLDLEIGEFRVASSADLTREAERAR